MTGHARRRVRPRFFLFVAIVLVATFWTLSAFHTKSGTISEPRLLPAKPKSLSLTVDTAYPPFALPAGLFDMRAILASQNVFVAGLSSHRSSHGLSFAITPQGVVQGPSPSMLAGGSLVLSQNMAWWAGGLRSQAPQQSAMNLNSNRTMTHFLPVPLANAAVAADQNLTFVAGGRSTHHLSDHIYALSQSTGNFHNWATLPQGVEKPFTATGGKWLIVGGGRLAGGPVNSHIWIYQLSSHRLFNTLDLPYSIHGAAMVYFHNHFWLLGGEHHHHLLSAIWLITPSAVIPTTGDLPLPLAKFGVGVLHHQIWVIGGLTPQGITATIRTLTFKEHPFPAKNTQPSKH